MAGLALAGCSSGEPAKEAAPLPLEAGLYADDGGRSGLCVGDGGEATFILYAAQGTANCMAQGQVSAGEGGIVFTPRGDDSCRFPLNVEGGAVRFGEPPATCAYYCGGEAKIDGRLLEAGRDTTADPTDPAGDPIC
ncbi:hypothetical protein [Sphingomicrobium aestuariivivum]|uniref:hypothetical protein n=1 Tax=Sphingomicrobium aestuariivivum TaxID=1582356 RepID=UPI001FD64B67|nr:hypothetical protein [Sphingomicrobium aestuariivivum]MCJ8191741.1 hypothetical protein [Sphingomicrobium aestuariivivum]